MNTITVETTVKVGKKKFNSVAEAEAYVNAQAHAARITAWMDHKGMPNGKGNRRASIMAILANWEADCQSGLVNSLVVEEPAEVADTEEAAA